VAHDFNNLLTLVISNAEILEEDLTGQPERRACASAILEAGERGAQLVSHLLTFARERPARLVEVEIGERIAALRPILERSAGPGVMVQFAAPAEPIRILSDHAQLDAAVLNLVINARDAMPAGGEVRIADDPTELNEHEARQLQLEPGAYCVLSVTDTGTGMPPEIARQAFEPFFTTKEPGKGTGLGLSVVHGILKEHGAGLKLHSVEGVGTMFDLWLESATPVAAEVPAVSAMTASSTGPVRHLLYVDDDDQINDMVVRTCAREGHRAHALSDPYQALEYVRTHGPAIDLAVFDHNMPTMAGAQLVAKVLQICPGLACAVVSAVVDEQLKQHALGKGALFVAEKSEAMVPALLDGLQRHRPRA